MDLTPFHGPPATAPRVPGFVTRTLLGFGTHGEVWLADDLSTGGTVALKIGRRILDGPAAASGDPPGARPEQETALLCRIDHPHIVRLRRVVPLPAGGLAMVLDLAAGGSLASLIAARGRFDPGEVSTLLVPLADALEHLHRRGVVHGDIAPGNVLFTGDGRPQLGDLGVARLLGTRIGGIWATPGFTDPALTRSGPGGIDLRAADLWGLAAVGWFALTGRPPEPAGSQGPVPERAPLGELLTQCLSAEPADRPSLHELADRAWQAARPTPVRLVTSRVPDRDDVGLPPLSDRVTGPVPVAATAPVPALVPGQPGAGTGDLDQSGADTPDEGSGPGAGSGPGPWDRLGVSPIRGGNPAPGAAGDRGGGRGRDRAGRFRGASGPRRTAGVITVVAVSTAVAAVGAAVTLGSGTSFQAGRRSPGLGGPVDATSVSGTPVGGTSVGETSVGGTSVESAGASVSAVPAGLEAEIARALVVIGRSRSAAFAAASERYLAGADLVGSPAYLADLALVQRLRARGYRLKGVRYQVSGVQVLHRHGELVDVRAMVTTSGHRQVRIGSGTGVSVPEDGPRPVVLTVAPVDLNRSGPTRWRVRSVAVPS